ncbi:MAG: hypothetical protein ACQEW2_02425 [Bacillota bacterium]
MLIKLQYKTDEERKSLIDSHSNLYLIEEQNIIEGNFLIFSENKPPEKEILYVNVPQQDFENLKTKIETTQEAVDFLLMGGI